jgi:hypothetical protein
MHACVHCTLTRAVMGGILTLGRFHGPINVDSALNFGGSEDAFLKFCPCGCQESRQVAQAASIDLLIGALKRPESNRQNCAVQKLRCLVFMTITAVGRELRAR